MPWRGLKVLVTKRGHQLKAKPMVVVSVLANQDTPSGLKVEVHSANYDPNAPFAKTLFDYDHIVEFQYVYYLIFTF
jgi:hypothetical protein